MAALRRAHAVQFDSRQNAHDGYYNHNSDVWCEDQHAHNFPSAAPPPLGQTLISTTQHW